MASSGDLNLALSVRTGYIRTVNPAWGPAGGGVLREREIARACLHPLDCAPLERYALSYHAMSTVLRSEVTVSDTNTDSGTLQLKMCTDCVVIGHPIPYAYIYTDI